MTSVSAASIGVDPQAQHDVAAALYGLGAVVVRRIPREISLTAMSTMSTIDRTGPRRITDLAVAQGVSQPSMTTLVSGLQRDGYVVRGGDPADRRVALVSLTETGIAALRARRRAATDSLMELIDQLDPEAIATLVAAAPVLDRLRTLDEQQRG